MPANPNWFLARTAQYYAAEEATYAAAPTFAATDAIRASKGSKLSFNPRNLAKSPARYLHPSLMALRTRRQSGEFTIKGEMFPSGVLNTLPELDKFFKNGFGAAAQNIVLATTFSGSPTTTTGTIAFATGLVAGQLVEINIAAGANAGTYIRRLVTASTSAVWAPALPAAPVSGDTFKGMVTYTPGTALPKSLDIAKYPQAPAASTPAVELLGCVIDKISMMFDANSEPEIEFSGPAQGFAGSSPNFTPQAQPGAFTTVGAESGIPSGITGYFYFGGTLYEIEKLQIDLVNGMKLKNSALGTSKATGYYRDGKRDVSVKINAKVSDDTTMWTPSLASSSNELFFQLGTTAAKIWAGSLQGVVLTDNPDIPDGSDETQQWDFNGTALGVAGNDEFIFGAG